MEKNITKFVLDNTIRHTIKVNPNSVFSILFNHTIERHRVLSNDLNSLILEERIRGYEKLANYFNTYVDIPDDVIYDLFLYYSDNDLATFAKILGITEVTAIALYIKYLISIINYKAHESFEVREAGVLINNIRNIFNLDKFIDYISFTLLSKSPVKLAREQVISIVRDYILSTTHDYLYDSWLTCIIEYENQVFEFIKNIIVMDIAKVYSVTKDMYLPIFQSDEIYESFCIDSCIDLLNDLVSKGYANALADEVTNEFNRMQDGYSIDDYDEVYGIYANTLNELRSMMMRDNFRELLQSTFKDTLYAISRGEIYG